MPEHVGPIIFGHPIARQQLRAHGVVHTFRTRDRTTGDTWWRESRTGPKQGDVRVDQVTRCPAPVGEGDLQPYAATSGFASAADWLAAIHEVHGADVGGYVYRVEGDGDD